MLIHKMSLHLRETACQPPHFTDQGEGRGTSGSSPLVLGNAPPPNSDIYPRQIKLRFEINEAQAFLKALQIMLKDRHIEKPLLVEGALGTWVLPVTCFEILAPYGQTSRVTL